MILELTDANLRYLCYAMLDKALHNSISVLLTFTKRSFVVVYKMIWPRSKDTL